MSIKRTYLNILNKLREKKILDNLFIIGFSVFVFLKIFEYSQVIDLSSSQRSLLRAISILLILPKAVFQQYNKKELVLALLLICFSLLSLYFSKSIRLLILPLLLIGIRNIDIKKLVMIMFIITISAVSLHIIVFYIKYYLKFNTFIGITDWINPTTGKVVVLYNENNFFAERAALALLEYIYITDRDKNRIVKVCGMLLYSIFIVLLTESKASFSIMFLLIIFILLENRNWFKGLIKPFKYCSFVFTFIISFIILFFGNSNNVILRFLNKLISGRIVLCANAKQEMGLSLLPRTFEFEELIKRIAVDNAVTGLILKWGIILFIVYLAFAIFFGFIVKHDNITNYYIGIMSLWLLTEVYPIELLMLPLLIVIFNNYYKYFNSK